MNNGYLSQYGVNAVVTGISVNAGEDTVDVKYIELLHQTLRLLDNRFYLDRKNGERMPPLACAIDLEMLETG